MRAFFLFSMIFLISLKLSASAVIRINQMGYLPQSVKVAVYLSNQDEDLTAFQLFESLSGKLVFEGKPEFADAGIWLGELLSWLEKKGYSAERFYRIIESLSVTYTT